MRTFTPHASSQMAKREITQGLVNLVLGNGKIVKIQTHPETGNRIEVVELMVKGCKLHVALDIKADRVVTTFYKTASGAYEAPVTAQVATPAKWRWSNGKQVAA